MAAKDEVEAIEKQASDIKNINTELQDELAAIDTKDGLSEEETEALVDATTTMSKHAKLRFLSQFSKEDLADAITLKQQIERDREAEKDRDPEGQAFVDSVYEPDRNALASLIQGMRF